MGEYQKQVQNGIATLSDLKFIANPGTKNVTFLVTSSSIDNDLILKNYNISEENINQDFVTFDFRLC